MAGIHGTQLAVIARKAKSERPLFANDLDQRRVVRDLDKVCPYKQAGG
jgi:hypothetical protein